jgi:hypothetical protein
MMNSMSLFNKRKRVEEAAAKLVQRIRIVVDMGDGSSYSMGNVEVQQTPRVGEKVFLGELVKVKGSKSSEVVSVSHPLSFKSENAHQPIVKVYSSEVDPEVLWRIQHLWNHGVVVGSPADQAGPQVRRCACYYPDRFPDCRYRGSGS